MHALFHRALTPQTITSAWLVATVALTLALALAQSGLASAASPARGGLPAGGTGPHGPPAGAETQPILVSAPHPGADLDLDSILSLRVATAVVTTFEVLPSLVSPADVTA